MKQQDSRRPADISEQEIEKEIQEKKLNAPRLTPSHIDAKIEKKEFHVFKGSCLTVCCLTLENGFTVSGESACASPENFDKEIGEKIAFENARNKIWELEGYLLKERLFKIANLPNEDELINDLARIAHEVNASYCRAIGDDSQPSWSDAPEWQKKSAFNGVQFHLNNPGSKPEDSHANWLKEKLADGWKYGEVKDPDLKTHPCCVEYDRLPIDQRVKDHLFIQVIRSLANYEIEGF